MSLGFGVCAGIAIAQNRLLYRPGVHTNWISPPNSNRLPKAAVIPCSACVTFRHFRRKCRICWLSTPRHNFRVKKLDVCRPVVTVSLQVYDIFANFSMKTFVNNAPVTLSFLVGCNELRWTFKEWKWNMLHSKERATHTAADLTGWRCSGFCVEARAKQWATFAIRLVHSAARIQQTFNDNCRLTACSGCLATKNIHAYPSLNFPNKNAPKVLKLEKRAKFKRKMSNMFHWIAIVHSLCSRSWTKYHFFELIQLKHFAWTLKTMVLNLRRESLLSENLEIPLYNLNLIFYISS